MAAMEALGAVVCEPGAQTTDPPILSQLLTNTASLGRPLFQLVMHPAKRVADGAALVMRAIAETGASAAMPMREAALREGAFLHHLSVAMFAKGPRLVSSCTPVLTMLPFRSCELPCQARLLVFQLGAPPPLYCATGRNSAATWFPFGQTNTAQPLYCSGASSPLVSSAPSTCLASYRKEQLRLPNRASP